MIKNAELKTKNQKEATDQRHIAAHLIRKLKTLYNGIHDNGWVIYKDLYNDDKKNLEGIEALLAKYPETDTTKMAIKTIYEELEIVNSNFDEEDSLTTEQQEVYSYHVKLLLKIAIYYLDRKNKPSIDNPEFREFHRDNEDFSNILTHLDIQDVARVSDGGKRKRTKRRKSKKRKGRKSKRRH